MLEGQPIDKQTVQKRRESMDDVVKTLTHAQLDNAFTTIVSTQALEPSIKGKKNIAFLDSFGQLAEAIFQLPERLDELAKKGIGKPIMVHTDAGEEQFVGSVFPTDATGISHVVVFKNRKIAATQARDRQSRMDYFLMLGDRTDHIEVPEEESVFDGEGELDPEFPSNMLETLEQECGVSVTAETHLLDDGKNQDDGLIGKIGAANEMINRKLNSWNQAA